MEESRLIEAGIFASKAIMQCSAQVIQIRAWSRLSAAVLFWRCKAGCSESLGILQQALLEGTCDPEVDQIDIAFGGHHDITGFEITENDRRSLLVQVGEHI